MNCAQYQSIFDAYVDGSVTLQQKQLLQKHIQDCDACRRQYQEHLKMQTVLSECFTLSQPSEQALQSILTVVSSPEFTADTSRRPAFRWGGYALAAGIFLVIGLLLGSGRLTPPALPPDKPLAISISDLRGDILVKHPWDDDWKMLTDAEPIYKGDSFRSLHQSAVKLVLGPGKFVELNENSSLNLLEYNGKTEFGIAYGTVKSTLEGPHEPFYISTPQGRFEALGTEFIVRVR